MLHLHQVFVPHGQCVEVHLGGHVQTGGYGQLGRSFGLLGDHVTTLEIIDHAGQEKEITKLQDPDLFYAWLGGSPGNLGVLTHFTIEAHRDSNYPGSIGLRVLHLYNTAKLRKLVGYLAEMNDNPDFPRNYDLCISVLSANADIPGFMDGLDEDMEKEHPEIFGKDERKAWPRMIVVYAQWVPFSPEDKPDMSWFKRLENDSWFFPGDDVEQKPMSELTAQWIFRNTREFDLPYVKRTYVTNSTNLSKNGWVDWIVSRMDRVVQPLFNGQWLSAQLQCFGGKHSQFRNNAGNGTSYSVSGPFLARSSNTADVPDGQWRDQTMCMTIDNFHYPEKRAEAEAWQKANDEASIGPDGIFSKQDRRVLWGSWGSFDLNADWRAYYDSEENYKRVQKARKMADPHGTFTPNTFAVKRAD